MISRYKGKKKPDAILAEILWWSKTVFERTEEEEIDDTDTDGGYDYQQEEALMEYVESDHSDDGGNSDNDGDDPMGDE